MSKHAIALAAAVLLALGGCAQPPTLAQLQAAGKIPPVSGDLARIYVFRNFPHGHAAEQPVASIAPGSVFERDVTPGRHIVTTDPEHPEYAEIASLSMRPGSTVYLAVDDNWVNNDTQGSETPIFSIAPIDPFIARLQAGRLPLQSAASEGQQAP